MDRDDAARLLSEYLLGQLDEKTSESVAGCVANDPELQKHEEFLRWLMPRIRDLRDHLPGQHPTGEELVHVAIGQGEIASEREDWARDHLGRCEECNDLVNQIQAVERDLGQDRGDKPRAWTTVGMAALLAFTIVSAGLWIWLGGNQDIDPQYIQLSGLTRSQEVYAQVAANQEGELPPLLLECDPWIGRASAADFPLQIRLTKQDGATVVASWEVTVSDVWSAEKNGLLIGSGTPAPEPGIYLIEVRDETGAVIFRTGFDLLLP